MSFKWSRPLAKRLEKAYESWRSPMPKKYKGLYAQAMAGSKRAAIRLFCLECVGFQEVEVTLCTCPYCPLYLNREPNKGQPDEAPIDEWLTERGF